MKIYMDNCCLNRPFDNQSNIRIHLESEAIKLIITECEQKIWTLISSQVLEFEISNTPDISKKDNLLSINKLATVVVDITNELRQRAKEFESFGLQTFDAMHLASAENNADILLSVDDKFINKSKKIAGLGIKVQNPLLWLEEILP
jgi:predicted nucleic acid-binding protein